jgi:hypothetical protein
MRHICITLHTQTIDEIIIKYNLRIVSNFRKNKQKKRREKKEIKNDAVGTVPKSNRKIVDRYKRLTYISMASHFPILVLLKEGDI